MSYPRFLLILALGLPFFLSATQQAKACSCDLKPTVLESYERATQVVIVKAISVEKIGSDGKPQPDKDSYDSGEHRNIRSTTMKVEKVFKGTLKVGEEIKFRQGRDGDCAWTFSEDSIGAEYLFYVHEHEANGAFWRVSICGRSNRLEFAADDLLYLENRARMQGKTRLSGTLSFSMEAPIEGGESIRKLLADIKIIIKGEGRTYELQTDKNGVYEIYDLLPGQYSVLPTFPKGMNLWYASGSSDIAIGRINKDAGDGYRISVVANKHAYQDFHLCVANTISGRLFDNNNNPLKDVSVRVVPAEGKMRQRFLKVGYTAADGSFEIDKIPPGGYVLIANDDGKISSSEPFGVFYYPNVTEREKAAVITLGFGESADGLVLHAPSLAETVAVEGVFLYSDGKPVVNELIKFKANPTDDSIEGDASASTDEQGHFSLKILKGLPGTLSGGMNTYVGEFENCPKLDALIKKTGDDIHEMITPGIPLEAKTNLYNLELRFPFPGCKKAKR